MDFKDSIKQLSERVDKLKENIQTEEATKNAFILPFIQALGYDVFNPLEVVPEYTCDIGTKKGEKIDFAIMKDGAPIILIECKHWGQNLSLHDNQLLRYFHVSNANFGILTNGIVYRFYTDLEKENVMDEKPFLEVDILNIKDSQIEEIKKFHKSYFDVGSIFYSASELKYTNELKQIIGNEFVSPSPEFVKLLTKQVYPGMITAKVLEQFSSLVKRTLSSYTNDLITDRLKTALSNQQESERKEDTPAAEEPTEESKVITTDEEKECFFIVKSILWNKIDVSRVSYRDSQTYCAILVDDNNRKTICRLYFNGKKKVIAIMDDNKKEVRKEITSLNDVYGLSEDIIKAASAFS